VRAYAHHRGQNAERVSGALAVPAVALDLKAAFGPYPHDGYAIHQDPYVTRLVACPGKHVRIPGPDVLLIHAMSDPVEL